MINKLSTALLATALVTCVSANAAQQPKMSCQKVATIGSHVKKNVCVKQLTQKQQLQLKSNKALLAKGRGESSARKIR